MQNRLIKFRAYIKSGNKIYPVVAVHAKFDDENFNRVFILKPFKKGEPKNYKDGIDCELMQFTGLKDKNGKEIYEGDIIRHIFHPDRLPVIKIVKFDGGAFIADRLDKDDPDYLFMQVHYEIIGNIYENPELI